MKDHPLLLLPLSLSHAGILPKNMGSVHHARDFVAGATSSFSANHRERVRAGTWGMPQKEALGLRTRSPEGWEFSDNYARARVGKTAKRST